MKHLTIISGLIFALLFTLAETDKARAQKKISNPDIVVSVDGLACPFCAYGLEKKLKKLDGVKGLYVDIDKGLTQIKLKKQTTLAERKIKEAVENSGFTAKDINYKNKEARPSQNHL